MTLLAQFLGELTEPSLRPYLAGQPVIAAVSGGADSLCLLHLLTRAASDLGMTLHVATFDHGLRDQASADDADFVAATAQAWHLPCHHTSQDVRAIAQEIGLGIEAAARRARYTFLAEVARQVGAQTLIVGHTADDQAETVLLHLLRGTGLAGLRGMQPLTRLSVEHVLPGAPPVVDLVIARPLLAFSRAEVEAYCAAHGLQPRHDATNDDTAYLRNRVRHDLLPLLESFSPGARTRLARTGRVLAADFAVLQAQVSAAFEQVLASATPAALTFDLARYHDQPLAIRRGLIRMALARLLPGQRDLSFDTVEHAVTVAQMGTTGSASTLPGGIVLRIEYAQLTLSLPDSGPALPDWPLLPPDVQIPVAVPGETPLPDSDWVLYTRWLAANEDPTAYFRQPFTAVLGFANQAVASGGKLVLRTRQPGDRMALYGLAGRTQKVSDLLINAKIAAAWRDHLPVVACEGKIIWVVLP
ncbi:MAG: tRNA lysidine(34) synthetase TilS, partial [Anaerolineae bacterium]|nr:tRNA lysidine(34) synthetase TilS [Anaerolineae bacterium]